LLLTLCCGGDLATTSTARSKRDHASACVWVSLGFDMPQPLNRVVPDASFMHNPNVLDDKPHLSKYVANIFGFWTLIEYRLSLLLIRVLGADAHPAIAIFSTLTAQHLQLKALEAAAKAALSTEEFDVFQAGIDVTDSAQSQRNKLAHWIWGSCPELPDALLVADPKAHKDIDRELQLALEQAGTKGIKTAEMAKLNRWDSANIYVYREADLQRASRDLGDASQVAFLLVIYLDGLFCGRRQPTNEAQAKMTRGHVYRQLSEIRLFREALARIHADQQKPPQSQRGSPPPTQPAS
jgi:hypothetical protein